MLLSAAAGRLATAAPAATAGPQVTAARLDVEAQPACSTRDELVARVAARSNRIRFVSAGAGVPVLTARIEVAPRGVVIADLTVLEPDGRKFQRRIEAPSCAAATDALALVIAITLDPSAATGEVPGTTGADSGSGATDATPPNTVDNPSVVLPPPPPPVAAEAEAVHHTTATAGGTWFSAGLLAAAVAGPAPVAMPGPAVEVQVAFERASILSPALALTFAHLWSEALKEEGGTAAFTLDLVGLDACPVRLALFRLEARACAAGSLGRLAARGSNAYDPSSVSRPFATAGGTARLAVLLPWRIEVSARFGVGATLWRDAFEFTPKVFHRAASVTLVGDVGIGVRFP